jgi:toxin ParE1/3/4
MTKVIFRPAAEADLAAISLFIAEHSVKRARAFVQRLREKARILESSPLAGRARPELGPDLRGLLERPYLLIYQVKDDVVEIVAVVHSSRDLPAALSARLSSKSKE